MVTGVIGNYSRHYASQEYRRDGRERRLHHEQLEPKQDNLLHDSVELSPAVPKPFAPKELSSAIECGQQLVSGHPLPADSTRQLREERVFAAVVALEAMHANPSAGHRFWPLGTPRPTPEELEEAYRRLSQRVGRDVGLIDPATIEAIQQRRRELLEAYRMADFEVFAKDFAEAV